MLLLLYLIIQCTCDSIKGNTCTGVLRRDVSFSPFFQAGFLNGIDDGVCCDTMFIARGHKHTVPRLSLRKELMGTL